MNLDYFANKKILITGGAGYLANSLINDLKTVNCVIIRFDREESLFPPVIAKAEIVDFKGNIQNQTLLEKVLNDVDFIFHFAAQTSLNLAEQNPSLDFEINVIPIIRILEICQKRGICPVILFSGTATEFGLQDSLPVNEMNSDKPATIYDLHKLIAEKYLLYYAYSGIVKGAVLRLANVYGPGPKSSSSDRGILNIMIRKALNGQSLTIYGEGNFIRDYIYVEDVSKAFLKTSMHIDQANGKFFVVGSGEGHTVAEAIGKVAASVAKKTGICVPVINVPAPESLMKIEFRNFIADTTGINKAIDWNPTVSLQEGIDRTIEFFLKN
jgi:UDP-glucose 4-epimerase